MESNPSQVKTTFSFMQFAMLLFYFVQRINFPEFSIFQKSVTPIASDPGVSDIFLLCITQHVSISSMANLLLRQICY
jgi:hypothetical protein